ncbi:protein takeout-like [Zophobas morio]|uniref:protein takeout-like n=1 Tax=Zophobas morio TaxID=2755281 RepID=UPI003082BAEA
MKLVVVALVLTLGYASVPPNFKRCLRKDPDFNKCYLEAAQYGASLLTKRYDQLDIPNLDPFKVTSLVLRTGQGPVNLEHNYTDCSVYGLTTIKFDIFELDLEKNTLMADGTIDQMVFKCSYHMTGRILLLAVRGDGNSTITFKRFRAKYKAAFDKYLKNEQTYYRTVNTQMESDVEHVHFDYDNLFNGNRELGDNLNFVLNDNWRTVFADAKADYDEIVRQIMTDVMEKIWGSTSLQEFFD